MKCFHLREVAHKKPPKPQNTGVIHDLSQNGYGGGGGGGGGGGVVVVVCVVQMINGDGVSVQAG